MIGFLSDIFGPVAAKVTAETTSIALRGRVEDIYTMLTMNADAHPLMRRMPKPDPTYGLREQDKRSVVVIEASDFSMWLMGTRAALASCPETAKRKALF